MARARRTHRTTFLISIICGFLCATCVFLYLQGVQGQVQEARAEALARYGGEQLEVCVATRDIGAGETVDAAAVQMKMWLVDLMPDDVARSLEEVVGKRVSSPILKGEVVSQRRFESTDSALEVPQGFTAISVPAKDVQAVGGAITPGMKVDLYATGGSSTQLIGQGVAVLATNASMGGSGANDAMAWITIAVEPASVQEVVSAAQNLQLYFALPNQTESNEAETAAADESESNSVHDATIGQEPTELQSQKERRDD